MICSFVQQNIGRSFSLFVFLEEKILILEDVVYLIRMVFPGSRLIEK
jgi:hypothetical protein